MRLWHRVRGLDDQPAQGAHTELRVPAPRDKPRVHRRSQHDPRYDGYARVHRVDAHEGTLLGQIPSRVAALWGQRHPRLRRMAARLHGLPRSHWAQTLTKAQPRSHRQRRQLRARERALGDSIGAGKEPWPQARLARMNTTSPSSRCLSDQRRVVRLWVDREMAFGIAFTQRHVAWHLPNLEAVRAMQDVREVAVKVECCAT